MNKYFGSGTRAAEGSDLDKVLSGVRDNACCPPLRRAVSWGFLSLVDSPDPAGVGVGRARFGSWWPTQISVFLKIPFWNVKRGALRIKTRKIPFKTAVVVVWELDRRCLCSPVANSSLVIFDFRLDFFLVFLCFPPVCLRWSLEFYFLFFIPCLAIFCYSFCLCSRCFPFSCSICTGYRTKVNIC